MKYLSRVVWSEGMYLAPHHFQTQSRYFEDSIAFLSASLWREPWGLLHLEMDTKAIANGAVAILGAAGIFQDGLAFDMPTSDALPAARSVESLAKPSDAEILLYLAIPARRNDGYDLSTDDPAPSRYSGIPRMVRDETNGVDEYEVALARKNIAILSEAELASGVLAFPIARIKRTPAGTFSYDPESIPCSLRVSASDVLMLQLRRLLAVIAEKTATIARPVQQGNRLRSNALAMDIANYWFLHALHSTLPVLHHLLNTRHAHPSECFLELSRLAGALCTFALESDPKDLPSYNHSDPGPAFRAISAHILHHLEIVVPTNSVQLRFTTAGPYIHNAGVTDERCLRRARWILGIRSSLGESEQLRLVPRLIKVCSARFVGELVKRALPGMPLTHLPVPPAALRDSVDMQYYSIDTAGPCWQHILQTKSVGIYIPGEISDAEFTLTVLLEQSS
jgi:type VI secretion system protein ImpJ